MNYRLDDSDDDEPQPRVPLGDADVLLRLHETQDRGPLAHEELGCSRQADRPVGLVDQLGDLVKRHNVSRISLVNATHGTCNAALKVLQRESFVLDPGERHLCLGTK